MKKAITLIMFAALACSLSFVTYGASSEFKGVWVSSVFNMDYPSAQGLTSAQLKKEADNIISNAKLMGLNAIVLQVRPCGDSLFPSKIFPWSQYISGKQGVAPPDGFDPLAYFIKNAHAQGIEIHAWCNPYRVTKSPAKTKADALALLATTHPAVKNPDSVIFHTDGNLYFDPGQPASRTLITQGILEIVENYDIDAIHLDDYFYPGADFSDAQTYKKYGKDFKTIDDFRRNSVTIFVENLYNAIKSAKKDVELGISPFGIWANKSSNPEGSDTIGGQSYYQHYADTKKWVKKEIVDYICPQLYWHIGAREGEFTTLLSWWKQTVKGTDVKLYSGLGAYRLTDATADSPWYGTDMLARQIAMSRSQADGVIFFRYRSLLDNLPLKSMLPTALETGTAPNSYTLSISRPNGNIKTTLSSFYITGTSDISSNLTINGTVIKDVSISGFWGVSVPLQFGENHFKLQNGAVSQEIIITRTPQDALTYRIEPTGKVIAPLDMPVMLKSYANSRAKVSVFINGKLISLKNNHNGSFSSAIRLPVGQYSNLIFFISLDGVVLPVFPDTTITVLPENSAISATVTSPTCDIYRSTDPSQGAMGFLKQSMSLNIDYIASNMAYASNIGYIPTQDIKISTDKKIRPSDIKAIDVTQSSGQLRARFSLSGSTAAWCSLSDGIIRLGVSPLGAAVIFESDFFKEVTVEKNGQVSVYSLTPQSDYKIGGADIFPTEDGFELVISQRVKPDNNLSGVKILLDAGHGGDFLGAMGADPKYPEKRGNLDMALELESQLKALGAQVTMTRNNDVSIDLKERTSAIFSQKPHVFISLHSNSAPDNSDFSQLTGIGLYYRGDLSQPLAQIMQQKIETTGRNCKQETDNLLYMCRSTISPSILIENEYMPNPHGLEKIMSKSYRTALCSAIAESLVAYFS